MHNQNLKPGDFVIHAGKTALVRAVSSHTCTVLPAASQHGAARVWNVDLGIVSFSTICGPIRVSLYEIDQWPCADCIKIGTINAAQSSAIRFAIMRTIENARTEAKIVKSKIFEDARPYFKSGGRRVGGARSAA